MRARNAMAAIVVALLGVAMLPPSEEAKKKHAAITFEVRIEKDREGEVLCALYRDEDNWLTDETFRNARTDASKKWVKCRFSSVPKGLYAIAALHDEDGDGEMDTNFIGLPEEGYAASRDAHLKGIGAPDWEDAVFRHRNHTTKQRARMKY